MMERAEPLAGPSMRDDGVGQGEPNGHGRPPSMRVGASTSTAIRRRLHHVPARFPVLIRLPNQRLKSVELHPGKTVSLGKFGSFRADDIIGLPYGLTFEITGKKSEGAAGSVAAEAAEGSASDSREDDEAGRQRQKEKKKKKQRGKGGNGQAADEVGEIKVILSGGSVEELEDNLATNEKIGDGKGPEGHAQTMTYLDIQALKEAGTQGREIVQQEVENNSTFAQRTSWSQQKFIMRKEAKHMRLFTPVAPTLTNVIRYLTERYERDTSDKLRGLRADALANMLSLAGVAPGRRFIVIDGVSGVLTGAVLERMAGDGRVLVLNDSDSPPSLDLMALFALPPNCVDPVLRSMHWACTKPEWQSIVDPGTESTEVTPAGRPATDRDRQRFRKRRAIHSGLERLREEYFNGQFDGLLVASPYDAASIVQRVVPFIAGSGNVVVHSPYLQPLTEAQAVLRLSHNLVNVSLSEPFIRRFQVLPGRMHPEMMTSATAGYILHAVRVLTEAESEQQIDLEGDRPSQEPFIDDMNGEEGEGMGQSKKARIV